MNTLSCKETQRLLAQRSSGLVEADRLRVELHVSGCDACSEYSTALARMVALVDGEANEPLSARARKRAIVGAVSAASDSGTGFDLGLEVEAQPRFRITWQLGAVAVAAAAVAAFFIMNDGDDEIGTTAAKPPPPGIALSRNDAPPPPGIALSRTDSSAKPGIALSRNDKPRLLSGKVVVAGIALSAAGSELTQTKGVSSRAGAELALADAHVVLGKRTTIDWSATSRRLRLRRGRVAVKVKSSERKLRVITPRFHVVVIGTSFAVTHRQVEVYKGRVKVLTPSGAVLAERLEAGSRWSMVPVGTRAVAPVKKVVDTAKLLRQARAALAKHQVGPAREHLKTAMAQRLSPAASAEAGTLLAEAALIEGKLAQATELYLRVAERYRNLSAGQNALYAAARLAAKRGSKPVARKLFKRYLERYPKGRFRQEAASNLVRLAE